MGRARAERGKKGRGEGGSLKQEAREGKGEKEEKEENFVHRNCFFFITTYKGRHMKKVKKKGREKAEQLAPSCQAPVLLSNGGEKKREGKRG